MGSDRKDDLAGRIIRYFGDHQEGPGRAIEINNGAQYEEIGLKDIRDLIATLLDLLDEGLLAFGVGVANGRNKLELGYPPPMRLTTEWQRHYIRLTRGGDTAFMAMQFDDEQMDRIYKQYLRPALAKFRLDLNTVRPRAGLIDDNIQEQIRGARLMLADLTHANHGVLIEVGLALGADVPVIYTCRRDVFEQRRIHFDADHHFVRGGGNEAIRKGASRNTVDGNTADGARGRTAGCECGRRRLVSGI